MAISAEVNPHTGEESGGQYEVYVAEVKDSDQTGSIHWEQLTFNSPHKNIRPIMVAGEGYKVLMWLSGPWQHYMSYQSDAVGHVLERPD
jgi:hypothetical protein